MTLAAAETKRRSLVLITVDCLRADHCGFYGYNRPTTPFLDSLALESIVVPTAVVAGAPTYYSLPAIFASRMPLALGRDVLGLAPGEDSIASTLQQAGYATAAFSAANPYISPRFGYDQGFDQCRDFLDFETTQGAGSEDTASETALDSGQVRFRTAINSWFNKIAQKTGLSSTYDELYFQYLARIAAPPAPSIDGLRKYPSADVVVEAAESWLASIDSHPFFLWIHLMDPHHPYYPPAAAFEELTGRPCSPKRARYLNAFWNRSDLTASRLQKHKQAVIELYDAGIRWVDTQIDRLVASLKRASQWDDCVFVLTADHGEEFLEHGRRYHAPVSLTDEITRVPLLLRVPGHAKARPSSAPFSHLNLAPTLLEILNVAPPSGFKGKSLWKNLQDGAHPHGSNDDHAPTNAIAECAYGCTNPFRIEVLLSPRLLSVRDGSYKLIIRLEPEAIEQIYDLNSDPRENNPLTTADSKQIRKRLLRAAMEYLDAAAASKPGVAQLRGRLRNLRLKLNA